MIDADKTFKILIREAAFTKEMLGSGVTQIRKANYATPGIYAQSFAALSIGFERIGKLCLILDYYIKNNGKFPDFNEMKKVGHDLIKIKEKASDIVQLREVKFKYISNLDSPIHSGILNVLHDYAEGDRYSNINILTGGKRKNDPISDWSANVDGYIFENIVSDRKKKNIEKNAQISHSVMDNMSSIFHIAETGETINSAYDAVFRTGVFDAVGPYRQFYLLQIIRYWVELLCKLGSDAMNLGRHDIPFFSEILGGFGNYDAYLRSRKTWINI